MTKITRRSALSSIGVLGVTAVLAACGSQPAAPSSSSSAGAPASTGAASPTSASVATTTAVPPQAAPQAQGAIKLRLGWWIPGDSQWSKVMQKSMELFTGKHPNINVQLESSPWADYWQRIQVQIAGGEGPDIQWTSGAYFANLQPKGAYLDLSDYVKRDNFDYSQYMKQDDFFPGGKVFTMPYSGWGGKLLSYDEGAFDDAGLKYPDETWTWDNLIEAAQKLTKRDSSGKVTRWGLFIDSGAEYGWLSFLRHNGANWIDDKHTKTTLDSSEAIEAMTWIDDAIHKYKVAPGSSEIQTLSQAGITAPFEGGRAAMRAQVFTLNLFVEQKPPANFRPNVVLFPTIHGKKRWGNGNTNPMTAAKYTKHPDEAWQVLLWLAGRESQELHLAMRSGNPSVYLPLNTDTKVGFLQPFPNLPWLKLEVIVEGLKYWTGLDFHPKWANWDTAVEKQIGLMYLGQLKAEEACKAAAKAGDQVLTSA